MMRWLLPLAALALLTPATAGAAEKIVADVAVETKDGVKTSVVNFNIASCEEECHVGTLVCNESTAISIVLADVDAGVAGQAITRDRDQLVLTAGAKHFDYVIRHMDYMEMTGTWWLTADEQGSGPGEIAAAIAAAKTVEMRVGKKTVALPVDASVKRWAAACK